MTWLTYALVLSLLLTAGAWALERTLGALRLPTRWGWLGAMAATAGLTLAAATGLLSSPQPAAVPSVEALSHLTPVAPMAPTPAATPADRPEAARHPLLEATRDGLHAGLAAADAHLAGLHARLDQALPGPPVLMWPLATGLLLLHLALGWRALGARRRRWAHRVVVGQAVRLSATLGPAVVGIRRPEVVLPRGLLALPDPDLRTVLRHEGEHVEAGDTRLLAAGLLLLLMAPWNPFLWLQNARLRDALEVDCDARVLRGLPISPRRYAETLLDAGVDRFPGLTPAPALRGPRSQLERRIRTMRPQRAPRRLAMALLGTFLAAGLLLVACEVEPPSAPDAVNAQEDAVSGDATSGSLAELRLPPVEVLFEAEPDGDPRPAGWLAVLRRDDGSLVSGVFRGPRALLDEMTDGTRVLEAETARFQVLEDSESITLRTTLDLPAEREVPTPAPPTPDASEEGETMEVEAISAPYLEGRAAGARIVRTEPAGDSVFVRLRSMSGIQTDERPLLVVDGLVVVGAPEDHMARIDPDDITSVEVIRGNDAVERFGERARDGAILIRTRD